MNRENKETISKFRKTKSAKINKKKKALPRLIDSVVGHKRFISIITID
jgi:hypothetical protein